MEFVRLSVAAGFVPLDALGCGAVPAPFAGAEAPAFGAVEVGEFVLPAGPFAGFAPAVFDGVEFVSCDEAGPPPGACLGSAVRGALGAGPRVPASGFGLAAEVSAPEADRPVPPDVVSPGRCALAMRSVGAAEEAGAPFPVAGIRSVAASGRASAPAASAGPALSRAVFFSSFGSDTHTPR
ncbi:hypothetical protein IU450_01765 [Nocardia abscessus]|uniref:hypothetical protein n=1 Tax=Nocardia abscessus TaxID=120957 RepID=UPI001894D5D9|nr:hypothetical protein [Nocardia abscessus]MBF6334606.1 hypothetical protein [Nocardia abscessus]